MNLKTPAIHGGRPDDYYYVISGKKNTKTYYSNIMDCKIAKGEIDKSFISEIKERPFYDRYKTAVQLIEKREKLEEKLNVLKNQISALNDQLINLGISTPEEENDASVFLENFIKEKSARKIQFNIERDEILREAFKQNGWDYHGYPTGINPNAQKHPPEDHSLPTQSTYKPSRGNFNYHEDDSDSDDGYIKSDNLKNDACKSKFSYPNDILLKKNITTKKEWLTWLTINHVDRGGDQHVCSEVISAGRAKKW